MIIRKINSAKRNRHNRRTGVAAVEMAIVAPFVFLVIFGSMEFARMMMVRQALTNACREGCRNAALATTLTDDEAAAYLRTKLKNVMQEQGDSEKLRISFDPSFDEQPDAGTQITVTVEVDCAEVSWLPPLFFAGAQIRSTSSMARE